MSDIALSLSPHIISNRVNNGRNKLGDNSTATNLAVKLKTKTYNYKNAQKLIRRVL